MSEGNLQCTEMCGRKIPGRRSALATASTPGMLTMVVDASSTRATHSEFWPNSIMSEVDEIFAALGGKSAPVSHDKQASTKKEKKASSKRSLEENTEASDDRAKKTKKRAKQASSKGAQSDVAPTNTSKAPRTKDGKGKGAASGATKGDALAKGSAAVPTKPKTRAPTVVHDTSNQTRSAPSQPRPAKLDDEDAAFADSRGKDRTWHYLCRQTHRRRFPHFYGGRAEIEPRRRYVAGLLTQALRYVRLTATAVRVDG